MGAATARPAPPRPYRNLKERILANVDEQPPPAWADVKGPCWIWRGAKNSSGYGTIGVRHKARGHSVPRLVHRLVLLVFFGIPLNKVECAMHLCSTKPCCNPDHLDAGTFSQNTRMYLDVEKPQREPGCDD